MTVEKWSIYEIELKCDALPDNPFKDVKLKADFRCVESGKKHTVSGFYDGEDVFRIRFMPTEIGTYSYSTSSNIQSLDSIKGNFDCCENEEDNHGPVSVTKTYHFAYADGTPFFPMGTTAYAWTYRPEKVRKESLKSFDTYGFNKIRMLVFPKKYVGNHNDVDASYEPPNYPFEGQPNDFDFSRFNPEYFRNYEDRVMDLQRIGIEADVILFHPYDFGQWGIDRGMSQEDDLLYLSYIIARLGAYRNVWWSLANEYDITETDDGDFCVGTDAKDWDLIGEYVKANDPFDHPISAHNIPFGFIYPDRSWMTHVSYQHVDTYTLLLDLKREYKKPVINDEYQYEGNVADEWGNSDAETTLFRHWLAGMAGGYATHGEVYKKKDGGNKDLFWAYGGPIVGDSAPRLKYMKELFTSLPYQEMDRDWLNTDGHNYFSLSKGKDLYFAFFRYNMPGKGLWFGYWDGITKAKYKATIYDVWNCKTVNEIVVSSPKEISITEWTAVKIERT